MTMRTLHRRALAWGFLLVAVGFLLVGAARTHKVYPDELAASFGEEAITIPDWQLVIDTTFSGVARQEQALISTYDRTVEDAGKRACPT